MVTPEIQLQRRIMAGFGRDHLAPPLEVPRLGPGPTHRDPRIHAPARRA